MPRQNRVQPDGTIIATPARGMFMGNRGILHDETGRLTPARWRHKAWVCCVLSFKNRRRALMQPGAYTELFFLDEAVALAAGHRPCGECRRADFNTFRAALDWTGRIGGLDEILHRDRAIPRVFGQRRSRGPIEDLPDGAMIMGDKGDAFLVFGDARYPYRPQGYGPPQPRGTGTVTILTPAITLRALRSGFAPVIHPSLGR